MLRFNPKTTIAWQSGNTKVTMKVVTGSERTAWMIRKNVYGPENFVTDENGQSKLDRSTLTADQKAQALFFMHDYISDHLENVEGLVNEEDESTLVFSEFNDRQKSLLVDSLLSDDEFSPWANAYMEGSLGNSKSSLMPRSLDGNDPIAPSAELAPASPTN